MGRRSAWAGSPFYAWKLGHGPLLPAALISFGREVNRDEGRPHPGQDVLALSTPRGAHSFSQWLGVWAPSLPILGAQEFETPGVLPKTQESWPFAPPPSLKELGPTVPGMSLHLWLPFLSSAPEAPSCLGSLEAEP